MRSFLLKAKKPICKWGSLPPNTFFEGEIPEGYSLAVSPSENYIVIDVDRHGDIDGVNNIPDNLMYELLKTLHYPTKNNGYHYWFKYTGNKELANKTSGLGIDLRTNKGYVVYYPKNDIRDQLHLIKPTSTHMNKWLEKLFSYNIDKNEKQ
jgi:hypothetical protein